MKEINREFIEQSIELLKINNTDFIFERGGRIASNMYDLGDNIYYFQQHNFLPSKTEDVLSGHYTIVLNSKNLNYFIYKHSDYGGLTYTTESKDKTIYFKDKLPKNSRIRMDFIVYDALLGFYFYDGNHVNKQGKNLFPTNYCLTNDINDYHTIEKRATIFNKNYFDDIDIKYYKQIKQLKQEIS